MAKNKNQNRQRENQNQQRGAAATEERERTQRPMDENQPEMAPAQDFSHKQNKQKFGHN
ncbi:MULTISPECIES: hypothetical protein [unclassified Streptomyces]|uniref:hypothetical protein n=1 Tax=unclassified Streptomyces TaxID=2593676 RepID=UPI0033BC747D